jgi:fructokinase
MKQSPTVVGLGEILWDLLPSGRQLGGAPANFAYCSHLLGNRGVVASRIGMDQLGVDIRVELRRKQLADDLVQPDSLHPTGAVNVEIDSGGQPRFDIAYPAAWDFLEWNQSLNQLARSSDAVCFGSLAQRSPQSRETILQFLDATESAALRVFDVNLRQSFYSAQIIDESMRRATVVKLNDQELPIIAGLLRISEQDFAETAIAKFNLRLACLTRGDKGSLLFDRSGTHEHPGFQVQVKDAVGAGDAFTAGLVCELLRGSPLAKINDTANRMGAWVASCSGAMPEPPMGGLKAALARLAKKK